MKKALIFWFTGLSGAGKTTLANAVKTLLKEEGYRVLVLDGDEIRKNFHASLGFTREDIVKNNVLIASLCEENRKNYDVIFVAVISPYRDSREAARALLGTGFFEIYFSVSLETAMKRDVKGLYAKAKENKIKNMIGFSSGAVYEKPVAPDFVVCSEGDPLEKSTQDFYRFVLKKIDGNAGRQG